MSRDSESPPVLTNLKRYYIDARKLAGVIEHPEGDFVFFKDIERLLQPEPPAPQLSHCTCNALSGPRDCPVHNTQDQLSGNRP